MEKNLSNLSLEDLVALERMTSVVCGKYENIAQINKFATNDLDKKEHFKATNSLSYFNNKRGVILEEMEKRINELV
jgi:intergrase/recombinase